MAQTTAAYDDAEAGKLTDDPSSWTVFDPTRSSLNGIPSTMAVVRTAEAAGWQEFVVRDAQTWFKDLRDDLEARLIEDPKAPPPSWWAPPQSELAVYLSQRTGSRSALRQGRPRVVKALGDVPPTWGLYLLCSKSDQSWYVGISTNLRARLQAHARSGMLDQEAGDQAHYLSVKTSDKAIVVWSDLQAAEKAHIKTLTGRDLKVRNVTGGGNGRVPAIQVNVADVAAAGASTSNPLHHPRRGHLGLATRILTVERDWDLMLRKDRHLCAVPGSHGRAEVEESSIGWNEVAAAYNAEHNRDVNDDLLKVGWSPPSGERVPLHYWDEEVVSGPGQRRVLRAREVTAISESAIRQKVVPAALADAGLRFDELRGRGGINPVVYITGDDRVGLYAKVEENEFGHRAEMVLSALLSDLNWPGLGGRCLPSSDGNALIISAVGAGDIVDSGAFARAFHGLAQENERSLRNCHRPSMCKRVGLADLGLNDPNAAVRLLLFDAVSGNTDRHHANLNYGSRSNGYGEGRLGFLLPLDHGRALFNSNPMRTGEPPSAPELTVTGELPYANPNQMLRPVAELLAVDRQGVVNTGGTFLDNLDKAVRSRQKAGGWKKYEAELSLMSQRISDVRSDVGWFLDTVTLGVTP